MFLGRNNALLLHDGQGGFSLRGAANFSLEGASVCLLGNRKEERGGRGASTL